MTTIDATAEQTAKREEAEADAAGNVRPVVVTPVKPAEDYTEACAAFVKAQAAFEPVAFDKVNPHFRSKYASLSAILKATKAALNANGIGITARTRIHGDLIVVETFLVHKGKKFVRAEWPVGKLTMLPQQLGSALTYARRYALQSILGVAADDDDDGNSAQGRNAPAAPQPTDPGNDAADVWF